MSTQITAPPAGAEAAASPSAAAASAFDVCHVGVVLRVVLGVQLVVALGVSFAATDALDAVERWSQSALASLPASLVWLLAACGSKRWLERRGEVIQWAFALVLGALAGLVGHLQATWWDAALTGERLPWGWPEVPPMLAGAAMAGATLAWLKHRARSALPALASARLAELQARIRPHFLFNTLNTAIALVQIDPQRAESVLENLAELFRQALQSPSARTTLAEEIDLARRYLSIEQLRFGDRVTVRWELDAEAGQAEVPVLVLQPLVENAIRHGVEADPSGGWIVVRTRVQGSHVVLTVSNSVPATRQGPSTAGHGMALRNVRQRLRLMHDVECDFDAGLQRTPEGRQPPVYVVRVVVPLPRQARRRRG